MKQRISQLKPLLVVLLFAAVAYLLHRELAQYKFSDIRDGLSSIAWWKIAAAIGLTLANYIVYVGYDLIGLRSIGKHLSLGQVSTASLLSYVASNNLGVLLGGASVRYRLYTSFGLSTIDVVKVAAVLLTTFWMGLFALATVVFFAYPLPVPDSLHLPFTTTQPLAYLLATIVGVYFAMNIAHGLVPERWQRAIPLPGAPMAVVQAGVASADLMLAAGILYVLLPESTAVNYPIFLGIFLLAVVAVLFTQVPGGLGVFELVILALLPNGHTPEVVGALLIYRVVFYLLPLAIAIVAFAGREIMIHRRHVAKTSAAAGRILRNVGPRIFAGATFVVGALLMLGSAIPIASAQTTWLENNIPLPLAEGSHLLASLVGAALLLVARGLQRRLDSAYWLALLLLAVGAIAVLAKGHWQVAMTLGLLIGALAPCRDFFHRDGRLSNQPFSWAWIASIVLVISSTVWLGLFAFKHVEYANELWWRFGFEEDAPRFLRASFASMSFLFLFALFEMLRPAKPPADLSTESELAKALPIIAQSPRTAANLALLGDKRLLFNADESAFIMYGTQGRSWISMGDPVGPDDKLDDLVWSFRTLCDRYEALPVFYQVEADHLPLYLDHGLSLLKFGEEAQVPLTDFSLAGSARKQLRQTQNRFRKLDCTFEILDREQVALRIDEIKQVSDEWLSAKNAAEKGFSLGNFNKRYILRFPAAVIQQQGRILAFANVWAGENHEEMSIDLMRHRTEAPSGVMEHLFIELMLWGKENGYHYFSLGMAPLSGLDNRPLAPLWHRVGGLVFRHGEHFYNFEGLRNYKEKFDPEWRPKYIAAPGGFHVTRVLSDVATLISGGVRGLITR